MKNTNNILMRIQLLSPKFKTMEDIFKTLYSYFDISKGRHNEMSKVANSKVNKEQGRSLILSLIDGNKSTKEIATILGKEIHKISGRFSELKMQGKIELSHYKDGFSVYKLKK